ncbi:hypothetical protein GCM10022209_00490 [Chitinophaga oryziterrae]
MLTLLLIMLPVAGFSQEKEIFHVSWRFVPAKTDTIGKAHYVDAHLAFPVFKDSIDKVAGTVAYRSTYLDAFAPLYGVLVSLAWLHKLNDKHSIILFAHSGIFSDMKDISGEDLRGTIGIRYVSRYSEKFSSGFGLAYSKQFFGKQITPIIEMNYRFSDKLQFYGLLPLRERLEYTISRKSKTGIGVNADVASYRLSASEDASRYMRIAQWAGVLFYQYNFCGNWNISASVNGAIKQRFEVFDKASSSNWTLFTKTLGSKPTPVYRADQHGLQLQLSVGYTIQ